MNSYKRKWIARGIFFGVIFFALITLGTMYLWNNLMTHIFALPEITYLQTLGLMLIGRLLTGGFGQHARHRHRHWRSKRWRERWQQMSDDERQEFMHRCGAWWQEEPKNSATEEQK